MLTLWTPGGLEAMFKELSQMPVDSLRDPEVRRVVSARFDSIPVWLWRPSMGSLQKQGEYEVEYLRY